MHSRGRQASFTEIYDKVFGKKYFLYVYNTESGVGSEHWKSLHHQQSKIPSESLLYQIKKIRVLEGDFITETNVKQVKNKFVSQKGGKYRQNSSSDEKAIFPSSQPVNAVIQIKLFPIK